MPPESNSQRTARRVVVQGLVQGVFFRDTCRREARRAGVAGWVRNDVDGSVEAHFEGPAEGVRHMVAWAHEGPPHASVTRVEVHETQPTGATTFEVVG